MADEKQLSEKDWHKKFAIDIFNAIWQLLGKSDRTPDENEKMLQMAYASCYHWGEVGTALNQARGEWMISHVNIILERPQAALYHAKRSLAICEENKYGDFDLAYAYEGMARASALNHDSDNFKKYHFLAEEAARQIKGEEDRKIFDGDLISEPWFGMK